MTESHNDIKTTPVYPYEVSYKELDGAYTKWNAFCSLDVAITIVTGLLFSEDGWSGWKDYTWRKNLKLDST